jgi:hypothetical protein
MVTVAICFLDLDAANAEIDRWKVEVMRRLLHRHVSAMNRQRCSRLRCRADTAKMSRKVLQQHVS